MHTSMDTRPIGIFDSGIGGLTVVKAVKELLPNESIIYLGDTARVPYGTRSKETVTKFALDDVNFLLEQDVKCIVIACNTVASQAFEAVCKHSSIPVVSVLDAGVSEVKEDTDVLVLATRGTVSSHSYATKLKELNDSINVTEIACPLLVPVIEEGETSGTLIDLLLERYLSPLSQHYESVVLGCTHYPLIKESIDQYFHHTMRIIDSSIAVAIMLKETLEHSDLMSEAKGSYTYYLTDVTDAFLRTAEVFLGEPIQSEVNKIEL